jgi:CheY-like chemotaxis protein
LPVHPVAVLVVDDDPAVRSVLCRTIAAAGYTVHAAADGLEALTLLAAGLSIDVVITDLRMPRMDGRHLSAELGVKYPHVRVLFISGYDAHLGSVDLLGPVLPKPFRSETLIESVQKVLARQRSA